MTWADDVTTFRDVYADDLRLFVDGQDVTAFRADPARPALRTQYQGYQLQEPHAYGPATFRFPQISELEHRSDPDEQPADLKWLRKSARAELVSVVEGDRVDTLWRGFIATINIVDGVVVAQCGGEASGILEFDDRQPRVFQSRADVGYYIWDAYTDHGLPFKGNRGPNTGILLDNRGGGESYLDYVNGLLADAQNNDGSAWTIGRTDDDTQYKMHLKDTTTVHATIFAGTDGVALDVTDDLSEQPNTFYGSGIAPDGHKWMNAVIPGIQTDTSPPDYPISGGDPFGLGTTNGDTINGDGITILNQKLVATGFLDADDAGSVFDEDTEDAVADLQDRAGLSVTGVVNQNTWDALYDVTAAGFSIRRAKVLPLVQASKVRRWNRTAVGNLSGRNPNFDPSAILVARTIAFGLLRKGRARRWAKREKTRLNGQNWVGTITLDGADLFAGDYEHGDPSPTLLSRFQLRAGQNVLVRGFDGDTLFHVAGINVDGDGRATLAVDTLARDLRTVAEIVARNRESRRHRGREFRQSLRTSDKVHDAIVGWFEQGGKLGQNIDVNANEWTVFPVVGGQEGTVARLRLEVKEAPFYMAVFGEKVTRHWLNHNVGDPGGKDADGNSSWATNAEIRKMRNRRVFLYAAGTEEEPCGYGDKRHTDDAGDTTAAPVTGVFTDDAGFPYRCFDTPLLWVAVYPLESGTIQAGRIMWQQIEEGT